MMLSKHRVGAAAVLHSDTVISYYIIYTYLSIYLYIILYYTYIYERFRRVTQPVTEYPIMRTGKKERTYMDISETWRAGERTKRDQGERESRGREVSEI
jgi:hypothetical protein